MYRVSQCIHTDRQTTVVFAWVGGGGRKYPCHGRSLQCSGNRLNSMFQDVNVSNHAHVKVVIALVTCQFKVIQKRHAAKFNNKLTL